MKTVKQQLLTLVILAGTYTGLRAYEWDFMNTTDMAIILKMETRRLSMQNYYALIPPKQSVKFALNDAYCFLRASWAQWQPNKTNWFGDKVPYNSGFDLVTKASEPLYITKTNPKTGAVISKELIENTIAIGRIEGQIGGVDKQRIMGDKIGPAYSYSPMEIVMIPNELFKETVKASILLLKGIDKTVCQVINETKSFMGINAAQNLTKGNNTPTSDSSSSSSSNTFGPKVPLKDPSNCSFGLADIGAASGKLAGITLCGHRQFEIMFKLNKDGDIVFDNAGNPLLQLITNEGE